MKDIRTEGREYGGQGGWGRFYCIFADIVCVDNNLTSHIAVLDLGNMVLLSSRCPAVRMWRWNAMQTSTFYLRQGGHVFTLFVCLFAGLRKTDVPSVTKFDGEVVHGRNH